MKLKLAQIIIFFLWFGTVGAFIALCSTGWINPHNEVIICMPITIIGFLTTLGFVVYTACTISDEI